MSNHLHFPSGNPFETAANLEDLAADLRRLGSGETIDVVGKPDTPIYLKWGLARKSVTCIDGLVYGHPHLPNGTRKISSEIYAMDRAQGWVRTASRFYAIGPARIFGVEP